MSPLPDDNRLERRQADSTCIKQLITDTDNLINHSANQPSMTGSLSTGTGSRELCANSAERYDVFLSFTRRTPGVLDHVEQIRQALLDKGLTVFNDENILEFEGITDRLVSALSGSTVLLAYYAKEFPARYACQWELTMAFVAAQRQGDPRDRVLVINPEVGTEHLAPVELADAKFCGPLQNSADYVRLAELVHARVRANHGPLGALPSALGQARMPARVLRPSKFVGRYREMWEVHSGLHEMELPGLVRPRPTPTVLISGMFGIGKSSLAAQYAYLYRDAYPGGIFWIGPLDGTVEDALVQFTGQLRELASDLGIAVKGADLTRLRCTVADALAATGNTALCVVDDVPPDLPDDLLNQLSLPSPLVRTVLTSRSGRDSWAGRSVQLAGMSTEDVLAAFFDDRVPDRSQAQAVQALAERCGGHPLVVSRMVATARVRWGLTGGSDFVRLVDTAAPTVAEEVGRLLDDLGAHARHLIRVAAVLGFAPFPPTLAVAAHGAEPGADDPAVDKIAAAAQELTMWGLLRLVGAGWEVHPMTRDIVSGDQELHEVALLVAPAVVAELAAGPASATSLVKHAQALGTRHDLPDKIRAQLLREVAAHHEANGDAEAAWRAWQSVLEITDDIIDQLAAAGAGLMCGHCEEALRHIRYVEEHSANTDDFRVGFRARLLAAQTLDLLGRYAEAATLCWNDMSDRLPAWLSAQEQAEARLALGAALRIRGRAVEAIAMIEPLVDELRAAPSDVIRSELVPAVKLELARLQQLTGNARAARTTARQVMHHYRDAEMGNHVWALEAERIWADAIFAPNLDETEDKPEDQYRSERKLRALVERYETQFGAGNVLTLTVRVNADRALLSIGAQEPALTAMSETEQVIVRHLGPDHPLLLRTRYNMARVYGQLRDYRRMRDILEDVVERQIFLLGTDHGETLESKLELAIALMATGAVDRAKPLFEAAAVTLRRMRGSRCKVAAQAEVALINAKYLPNWVFRSGPAVDRLLRSTKKKAT